MFIILTHCPHFCVYKSILTSPINYTVYKTISEMDVNASCEKVVGNMGASKIYYEECSISNIDALGSIVSTGTIEKGNTKVTLIPDEFITSSLDGEIVYYYVILEYPNLDESQNIDMGGTFNGEITIEENEVTSDITIASIYIEEDGEYKENNNIPSEGYTLNEEKSTCNNNTSIGWDSEEEQIYISNLNISNTECTLYFDEYNPNAAKEYILSHYNQVLTRNDFSQTVASTTTGTIYKSLDSSQYDNDGEVYYFAGNPQDNWVKFGGFYWRIIRINGNGSIRMIYQGTEANTTGTGTQIGTSVFNGQTSDNAYVGYMYGTPGSSTYEATHANTNNSTIKVTLDNWYVSNLSKYTNKIDGNAGFCGDRTPSTNSSSSNGEGGIGTISTYYNGYIKLYNVVNPNLNCSNEDLYTISSGNSGNKSLIYPIGLISIDEVMYAGGVPGPNNNQYYLYTGQDYWTISPMLFVNVAYIAVVHSSGYLGDQINCMAHYERGVRPVINLRADLNLSGSGTSTDPYVVV